MEFRDFGRTGVKISALALGAMNFGSRSTGGVDAGINIVRRALDAGINVIDTADVYSRGESETIVGQALSPGLRDEVFLATKFHGPVDDDLNHRGNSRRWITREIEASLSRLRTDHIDLYQVHRPDPATSLEETIDTLTGLVRQGKIRYFGTSCFPASSLVEGQWIASRRLWQQPVSEQPPYSILTRGIERDVLPVAQRHALGVLSFSPLGGGWLSGRYRRDLSVAISTRSDSAPDRYDPRRPANRSKLDAAEALTVLAREAGVSLIHLALAFVLQHPAVTSAIVGPRTLEHLESVLGADKVALTPDILDRIDEIVAPGVTLNPADAGYVAPTLIDPGLRRR